MKSKSFFEYRKEYYRMRKKGLENSFDEEYKEVAKNQFA